MLRPETHRLFTQCAAIVNLLLSDCAIENSYRDYQSFLGTGVYV